MGSHFGGVFVHWAQTAEPGKKEKEEEEEKCESRQDPEGSPDLQPPPPGSVLTPPGSCPPPASLSLEWRRSRWPTRSGSSGSIRVTSADSGVCPTVTDRGVGADEFQAPFAWDWLSLTGLAVPLRDVEARQVP